MKDELAGHRMIAKAIIAAALIIVLAPLAYSAVAGWLASRALAEVAEQAKAQAKEIERQAAIAAYRRTSTSPVPQPMPLRQDETCTGGTILRAVAPPAKGWLQVLEGGKPVRCGGRLRI